MSNPLQGTIIFGASGTVGSAFCRLFLQTEQCWVTSQILGVDDGLV